MIPATWYVISLAVIFSPVLCILASKLLATRLLATCAIWQRPKRPVPSAPRVIATKSVASPKPIHYCQHRESAFGETKNQRLFFFVALCCLLGLVGFLRGYQVDFQTLDDDEYASIQAALAIAETGVPGYDHDIYYSRSPAHHYFAGLCVYLFGGDIWVLRMGQVFFCLLYTSPSPRD